MRRVLLMLATVLAASTSAGAQSRADFSGAWALDAAKSDPSARDLGPVTVVIAQSPTGMSVQTKRGESTRTVTYRLDGSVASNRMPNGDMVLSTSHWDGAALVTESRGALGESVVVTREVRRLDGNEMTVEAIASSHQGAGFPARCPQGSTTCTSTTQVFVRTAK